MAIRRSIKLSVRGFEISATEAARRFTLQATLIGQRGEHIKPHVSGTWRKSVVAFERQMEADQRWSEAIEELIADLGGEAHLAQLFKAIEPEFITFDLTIPARTSEEQEDGSVDPKTLSKIARLGGGLGFSFV